jgi:glycerophosphoryl diester phosphodiesterase
MGNCNWLKRPIAHRGLHDPSRGVVENSASAIAAAIARGFAVEVDLQSTRDDRAIVFHDDQLDRLTGEKGAVRERAAQDLTAIALRGSQDRILSLGALLALINDRVPLLIEIKGKWNGGGRFETTIAEELANYSGRVAVMSFDPRCVARFRALSPHIPRGLVSERFADSRYWLKLSPWRRFAMRNLLTSAFARPDFIAYDIRALPASAPRIARALGLPLLTWTVRSEEEKERAQRYADAMIFEGIEP